MITPATRSETKTAQASTGSLEPAARYAIMGTSTVPPSDNSAYCRPRPSASLAGGFSSAWYKRSRSGSAVPSVIGVLAGLSMIGELATAKAVIRGLTGYYRFRVPVLVTVLRTA